MVTIPVHDAGTCGIHMAVQVLHSAHFAVDVLGHDGGLPPRRKVVIEVHNHVYMGYNTYVCLKY